MQGEIHSIKDGINTYMAFIQQYICKSQDTIDVKDAIDLTINTYT